MEGSMEMRGGGTLTFRQEGPRVRLQVRREADGRGLYKAWLRGDGGGTCLLGTLIPEGGELQLCRTLSVEELERAGCWPHFRGEAQLAFHFDEGRAGGWRREPEPGRLLRDPVLRREIRGPMWYREEREGFSLAARFRTDRPVPLAVLFCLARVEQWEGQRYLVWEFDWEGWPRLPRDGGGRTRGGGE